MTKTTKFNLTVSHSNELRLLIMDGLTLIKVVTVPNKAKSIIIKRMRNEKRS